MTRGTLSRFQAVSSGMPEVSPPPLGRSSCWNEAQAALWSFVQSGPRVFPAGVWPSWVRRAPAAAKSGE
ncbi:hypothetical protein D3C59_29905 [Streptomyces sp. SHP22-7]|nr:hypothetical protein D3C59_33565 [Streptomyces sp. SHP22-7]RIH59079.1 hypothetical protein D3C59_29905 [Streptomyces sp. SHP22-7]